MRGVFHVSYLSYSQQVLDQYERTVKPAFENYIAPTKKHAVCCCSCVVLLVISVVIMNVHSYRCAFLHCTLLVLCPF